VPVPFPPAKERTVSGAEDTRLLRSSQYRGGPKCNGRPVSETPGEEKWWFLAGTFDGSTVERTCTMPAGRWLFFPVVNGAYALSDPEDTEEVARQAVNEFIDSVLLDPDLSMSVSVDAKEVLQRADSPLFAITAPNDNIFGLEPGSYDAVADGLWATVPPLSKGRHTVHFELSAPNADLNPDEPGAEGFFQDNTYRLTVKRANPAQ
jgi:hypothetical protein